MQEKIIMKSLNNFPVDRTMEPEYRLAGSQQSNSVWWNDYYLYNFNMSLQNSSFSAEPRIEDSILFEVNEQTLTDMNLTEHISRLEVVDFLSSKWFLGDAINKNRIHLYDLREVVKGQISQLKNSSLILQNYVRDETSSLKNLF